MQSSPYAVGDVLSIMYKGETAIARVAGYTDQLDETAALLVNLRVSGGLRWGERQIKIHPGQIIELLPTWEEDRKAQWEADLKAWCDERWAKMTDAEKERVHAQAKALGLGRKQLSPIERLIDQSCGL